MDIIYRKVEDLKAYERNNKLHPPEQIEKIKKSIETYGFNVPLIIDKEGVIIAGHGRKKAAVQLGMEKLPCIIKDDLSAEEIKGLRIMDNRSAQSDWDWDALKLEFGALEESGFDLDLTGFGFDEIKLNTDKESISSSYSEKITVPTYEPSENKPEVAELFNNDKCEKLLKEIKESNIDENAKMFLGLAAFRHIVFNYKNIADFYSNSNKEVQELMEKSALVIIDFDKAVENGFVDFTDSIFIEEGLEDGE